jgi:hypothetical protein
MVDSVWGGLPEYITGMFKTKKKPVETPQAPAAIEEVALEEVSAAPARVQALPQDNSRADAIQRGVAGFLGFVPKGGTRGDAADGFANIGRALLGENSVQQLESDYNQSIAPEKLRRALETGDVEAIKRLDPATASQVQGVDDTSYKSGRQRQFDDAVARGDVDAMRRLDPTKADERDQARRDAALRAARAAAQIGAQDPARGAAALKQFAAEAPNLFSAQELQAYEQGGSEALEAMLTGESNTGKDRFLSVGGGVYDMLNETWVEPQKVELTEKERADIELIRARTRAADRSNQGAASTGATATATTEAKAGFTGSLNNIADTAVKLAGMGAIGVDGQGARSPLKSAVVGAKNKDGNRGFIGSLAALAGDETAQLFNARETQVDFALRQFAAAAGIKSGSLNSNFELQNVKNALGDPFAPMEAQIAAADAMSLTYGDGTRTADYLLSSGKITQRQYADIISRTQGFAGNIQRGVAAEQGGGGNNIGGDEEIVSVTSVEEAMALPPGTVFKTPDGRTKVR